MRVKDVLQRVLQGVHGESEQIPMTDETDRQDDGLKNPMRFSIRNRVVSIEEKLHHPDFEEKRVTELEIQDGQLYVHWEWSEDTDL